MPSGIGPIGFILIVLVALLLFGPQKLPELGRAFGRTLREFKAGAREVMSDEEAKPAREEATVSSSKSTSTAKDHRQLPE